VIVDIIKDMLARQLTDVRAQWLQARKDVEDLRYKQTAAEKEERESAFAFRAIELEVLDPDKAMPSPERLNNAYKNREEKLEKTNRARQRHKDALEHLESLEKAVNKAYAEFLREP